MTNLSISRWWVLAMLCCFVSGTTLAQRKNTWQYLRIYEDNDAFNPRNEVSDRQYTNGTKIELFYTKHTKPRFLSSLLIRASDKADNLYGVGLTQLMYTPSDLTRSDISYGDRPYTGVLYLSHSLISSDQARQQKITTEFDLGVLGKAALAGETQIWVHKQLGFNRPMGWDHQLKSDVVINYLIQYEKEIIQPAKNLEIIGLLGANVGSLYNNLNAGITFRAGLLNDYFSNYERPTADQKASRPPGYRKTQFFFYMRPIARLVMDDSTLQGGTFTNSKEEYVIDRDLITRINVQFEYGFVLLHNRLGVAFSQKLRTAEFDGGPNQQYGNLILFIGL